MQFNLLLVPVNATLGQKRLHGRKKSLRRAHAGGAIAAPGKDWHHFVHQKTMDDVVELFPPKDKETPPIGYFFGDTTYDLLITLVTKKLRVKKTSRCSAPSTAICGPLLTSSKTGSSSSVNMISTPNKSKQEPDGFM